MVREWCISFYITFASVWNQSSFNFRQPELHENSPEYTGVEFKLAGKEEHYTLPRFREAAALSLTFATV